MTSESFHASASGSETAVQEALNHAEIIADDLVAVARTGDFPTLQARLAWVAIGGELLAERGEV